MNFRGRLLSSMLFTLAAGCGIEAEGSFDINSVGSTTGGGGGVGGAGGGGGSVQIGGQGGGGSAGSAGSGAGAAGEGGTAGTGGGLACKFPGECNDNNPCTKDSCVDGKCNFLSLPGANCADADKCNGEETCNSSGKCEPGEPLPIDDGKVCTVDICDPATGTINHKGQPDCECEADSDCNDGNACTVDTCKPDGTGKNTCSYSNVSAGTACNDGNKCTNGDQCDTGGKCQGSLINVDDGNPCTADSCDPATGQPVYKGNVGQACSDNNACSIDDACDAQGKCEGFEPKPDDGDPCTIDLCDPTTGNIDYKGVPGCKSCKGSDSDCDDGNPCTVDTCKVDICDYVDVPSGGDCNDGNACTLGDKCDVSGKCVGSLKNVDDGNPCTKDECDPATGNALYPPAPGQSCTDNNACTLGDICDEQGQCVGVNKSVDDANECTTDACDQATGNVSHAPLPNCKPCANSGDCDDNNPCTTESCNAGKCAYTNAPNTTSCSDSNLCTENDKCNGSGQCAGTPKVFNDNNPCTTDSCDAATGNAKHTPASGANCNDNNGCTLGDQCDQGACKGTPKNTDDANACTTDSCDQATGNVSHAPLPNCKPCDSNSDCNDNNPCTNESCGGDKKCAYTNAPNTTSCSDNNPCTTGDKCNGSGQCGGTAKTCTTPPGPCFTSSGTCNQADGLCTYPLASNGTSCTDSNACTENDACMAGTCVPGPLKTCTTPPNNQCYSSPGTCNTGTGACSYNITSGASCTDGNACTSNDTCNGSGVCAGATVNGCKVCTPANASTVCNDNNPCTNDVCTGGVCENPNNAASCNDNDACTDNDVCGGGTCKGTAVNGCTTCANVGQCNDNNVCTVDACTNGKCVYTDAVNGTSCDEGDQCTTGDTCQGGSCSAGTPKTCPNVCNNSQLTTNQACQSPNGNCSGGTTADCPGNHACQNATSCWGACTEKDSDNKCAPNFYCPGNNGTCATKKDNGVSCGNSIECKSNKCNSGSCAACGGNGDCSGSNSGPTCSAGVCTSP